MLIKSSGFFFLGVFYGLLITTANNIAVEMLIKEVVIPFLFDFWSVIQKVKLFEELKTASFFVLPKYKK